MCRLLRPALVGRTIERVHASDDPLVLKGAPPEAIEAALTGRTVRGIGRRGKYFWLQLDESWLYVHFGMSGWATPLEPDATEPRFTKLVIEAGGHRIAFTDRRRLGRIWLGTEPSEELKDLGFDALDGLPTSKALFEIVHRRNAPVKAVLLDQGTFAGIGNYLADEVLYQARVSPKRIASDLSAAEVGRLRNAVRRVVTLAVDAEADESRFPADWLFHHRWGGKKGDERIGRYKIVREEIAGRTTAWVPALQK